MGKRGLKLRFPTIRIRLCRAWIFFEACGLFENLEGFFDTDIQMRGRKRNCEAVGNRYIKKRRQDLRKATDVERLSTAGITLNDQCGKTTASGDSSLRSE